MRLLILIFVTLISCSRTAKNDHIDLNEMTYQESEILEQLDLAFKEIPSKYYPIIGPEDIKYNFFLDLEHGYFVTAGSRIHLFADSTRWIIVFEKSGYQNRSTTAEIELDYIGNCIKYPVVKTADGNYISNTAIFPLITSDEFERIENRIGSEMETFEFIAKDIGEIMVRNHKITFQNDYKEYEKLGIKIEDNDNPKKLIGFGELIRYLHETNPSIISATDKDIFKYIPNDIPKIMTINEFHYESFYKKENLPSRQECYQLIAKVLVTKDTTKWKPTLKPNNSWKNWSSGNL